MIDLYFQSTPNSMKVTLLLEELNLHYDVIDILRGEQHAEHHLAINQNGKVPALRDDETTIFDSPAILLYLARKHARFLPDADQSYASMLS